jgi:mono/diheme cytochrome c family protein
MRIKTTMIVSALAAAMAGAVFALPPGPQKSGHSAASTRAASSSESDWRIQGEQRFRTNCGRCHVAPHKFPPRMMATIVRHMRVRATLTEADMRVILRYMTQ